MQFKARMAFLFDNCDFFSCAAPTMSLTIFYQELQLIMQIPAGKSKSGLTNHGAVILKVK
jgi:hypothetical protein